MGSSTRLAEHYDIRAEQRQLAKYAESGQLQTLSARELDAKNAPVTIYPRPRKVRAWVRFGAQHARVEAKLCRSTKDTAGIEFQIGEQLYRCWVWGNAVTLPDEE